MAAKKKTEAPTRETPEFATPQEAYDFLRENGYDDTLLASHAAAARSWEAKGTPARALWEGVEALVKENRK